MRVTGDVVQTDSSVAGVQGSGNVDKIVVTFDAAWDGFAKTANWWDGHGAQAGEPRVLGLDMLVDAASDARTYVLVAPPEALRCAGVCKLAIDGYKDGALARTVCQEFQVVPAPASAKGAEMTPTQAQQLQTEIEALAADIAKAVDTHDGTVARHELLVDIWEHGERALKFGIAGKRGKDVPVHPTFVNLLDGWRDHIIRGGLYHFTITHEVTVADVSTTVTQEADVISTGDSVSAFGVEVEVNKAHGDLYVRNSNDYDITYDIRYIPVLSDQELVPKDHLNKVNETVAANAAAAKVSEDNAKESEREAQTARDEAQTAKNDAEKAKTAAEDAQKQAQDAKGKVQDAQKAAEKAKEVAVEKAGVAEGAAGAAQAARDEAAGFAEQTAQSEAVVSGAVAGVQESEKVALAAAKEATTSLAALHMRDRVYVGPASMAADMLPGDILIINDGGAVVGGANYRDLLEEARKAAAGSANTLEAMAVLSVVNATNWRQDSAGALWTTDTLAVFRAKLTAFAGAAVAGGYQDPETGRCTATWAQVQAWFITGTLKTPLQADAEGYPWRTEPPKTKVDGLSERMDAVEQMLDQTAGIFTALAHGG